MEASKQNNLFILLYICTEPMHHSIFSPCAFNIISKQNYSCFCCLTEMNCTLRLASSKRLCRGCIRGCLHGVRKILALGRSEKAEKRFVCFTCRNFGRSGYQVDKEKKINCRPWATERPAAAMFVLFVPSTRIFRTKVVYMVLGSSYLSVRKFLSPGRS